MNNNREIPLAAYPVTLTQEVPIESLRAASAVILKYESHPLKEQLNRSDIRTDPHFEPERNNILRLNNLAHQNNQPLIEVHYSDESKVMVCKFERPDGALVEEFLTSDTLPDMPFNEDAVHELVYGTDLEICFGGDLYLGQDSVSEASSQLNNDLSDSSSVDDDNNNNLPSSVEDDNDSDLPSVDDYVTPSPQTGGSPALNPQTNPLNTSTPSPQANNSSSSSDLPDEDNYFGDMFSNNNNNPDVRGTKRKHHQLDDTDYQEQTESKRQKKDDDDKGGPSTGTGFSSGVISSSETSGNINNTSVENNRNSVDFS